MTWFIHMEATWSVEATWKPNLWDSISNMAFSKLNQVSNASPLSRLSPSHSHIDSYSRIDSRLSPSHSHTDSHLSHLPSPLLLTTHPLTLTQILSTITPLSLTLSTLTQSPLSSTFSSSLRCDFILLNPRLKYIFSCFSYCVIFSCGLVVFVPKLWLIWLLTVLF